MVQGIDLIQIDVAFLTYNPNRPLTQPEVKLDSLCTAGMYELKKHRELKRKEKYEMSSEAYQHYKWYNSILTTELLNREDDHTKLKIYHWHIESSNVKAFTIDEVLYKAVSVIISPTLEYWYCANAGRGIPHIWGSRPRPRKSELQQRQQDDAGIVLSLTSPSGDREKILMDPNISPTDKAIYLIEPPPLSPQPSTSRAGQRRHGTDSTERLCSAEFCANNCDECKGRENPTTISRKPKCACYITKKKGKYRDNGERSENSQCASSGVSPSCVSLNKAIAVLNEKKTVLLRGCEGPMLRTINE